MADISAREIVLAVVSVLGALGTMTGGRVAFLESGNATVAQQRFETQRDVAAGVRENIESGKLICLTLEELHEEVQRRRIAE